MKNAKDVHPLIYLMIATMKFTATEINAMEIDELFLTATCRVVNQVNEASINKYNTNKLKKKK